MKRTFASGQLNVGQPQGSTMKSLLDTLHTSLAMCDAKKSLGGMGRRAKNRRASDERQRQTERAILLRKRAAILAGWIGFAIKAKPARW